MLETNSLLLIFTRGPGLPVPSKESILTLQVLFLVTDAHSKWIEATIVTTTTASKTITELHKKFAAYGLPEKVISDNDPQFTSNEFDEEEWN